MSHGWCTAATTAVLIAFASCVGRSGDGGLSVVNLTGVFAGNGRIAIVDISNRVGIFYSESGVEKVCGWLYSATPTRALRGSAANFVFADFASRSPRELGTYLLFVDGNEDSAVDRNANRYESDDPRKLSNIHTASLSDCWKVARYWTHSQLEMMLEVVGDAEARDSVRVITRRSDNIVDYLGVESESSSKDGAIIYRLESIVDELSKIGALGESGITE